MRPTLKEEDSVLVSSIPYFFKKPKVGDIIILKKGLPRRKAGRYIIKRITKRKGATFFVQGDNENESIDSRSFGWISKKEIVGKVVWIF